MQSSLVLRLGRCAFLIVNSTFHGQSNIFTVRRQNPRLAIRKGSTVEIVFARWHYCSSKLCLQFGILGPDLYSKGSCPRMKYNFGTASYQLPSSETGINGDCVVQKSEVAKL